MFLSKRFLLAKQKNSLKKRFLPFSKCNMNQCRAKTNLKNAHENNILQDKIPQQDTTAGKLARNAAIGFTSSVTSDTISNSLRVLKVSHFSLKFHELT